MSGGDLAAVTVSVLALVAVAVLTWVTLLLLSALRDVRNAVEQVRAEALPALQAATAALAEATAEVERVGEILDAAEAISSRMDGASRAAYVALSKPVIKTAAVATGTRRAARRLRSSNG